MAAQYRKARGYRSLHREGWTSITMTSRTSRSEVARVDLPAVVVAPEQGEVALRARSALLLGEEPEPVDDLPGLGLGPVDDLDPAPLLERGAGLRQAVRPVLVEARRHGLVVLAPRRYERGERRAVARRV